MPAQNGIGGYQPNNWVRPYGQYNSMVNPYLNQPSSQFGATQPYQMNSMAQPAPQPHSIVGRVVNDETDIMPNEVPMDGSISVFPKADGSEVIMKSWNQNGLITTTKYVPVLESAPQEVVEPTESVSMNDILGKLDKIEKKIGRITYDMKKQASHQVKKEEDSDEH